MSVYDEIKKKFILPNAYEDWKDFRTFLTEKVIGLAQKDNLKTVLVIGAGRCNDIDIHRLCSSFDSVTLLDYDSAAFGFVKNRLSNPEIRKVQLLERSLTGITEKDISLFCDNTILSLRESVGKLSAEYFEKTVFSQLEGLTRKVYKSESYFQNILPVSDIILCNGVFSQLFSTISFFIRSCAASLPGEMIPKAMEIADKADNILMETGHKIIPLITNAIIKSANSYAVFGNEYSEAHPVEGATQCIDTLRSNPNILEETTTHWNFNPSSNIQYQMLIHTIKT